MEPPEDIEDLYGINLQIEDRGRFEVMDSRYRSVADETQIELREVGTDDSPLPDQTMSLFGLQKRRQKGDVKAVPPDPRDVHQDRSEYAQKQDEARDAQLTTDPQTYANDPDSYDFPGVDTGPQFRSTQQFIESESFIERVFDRF